MMGVAYFNWWKKPISGFIFLLKANDELIFAHLSRWSDRGHTQQHFAVLGTGEGRGMDGVALSKTVYSLNICQG